MTTLTVALAGFPLGSNGVRDSVLELASTLDDLGVDRLAVPDHVVLGREIHEYAWGPPSFSSDTPWLDPFVFLATMAATTSRARLSTAILITPLRPVPVLAKMAASLDVMCDGRLDLGVGVGWHRSEFAAAGVSFEDRGRILTEQIASCRRLWTESPATLHVGVEHVDVWCEPKPCQARLPVWFSGTMNARNMRRIVELGDGWLPIMNATVDEVAADARRLRDAWDDAGRGEPGPQIQIRLPFERDAQGEPDVDGAAARVPELIAAGATDIRLTLAQMQPPDGDPIPVMQRFLTAFREAGA